MPSRQVCRPRGFPLDPPRFLAPLLIVVAGACFSSPDDSATQGAVRSPDPGTVPSRVVALVPSLAEIVVAIGGEDRLAGRTDYDTHPTLASLPSVGGGMDPSLETMVELGVDVVLMSVGRDAPMMAERFEKVGMRVVTFPIETVDDMYESIRLLGEVFGRQQAADSLSNEIRTELGAIRARVEGRTPVPVMYVVWADPPMTTGRGTFIDEVIGIAGGVNVFADSPIQWPTVGFEAVIGRAPEVLIWPRGEATITSLEQLKTTAGWREVDAVRAGRVVLVEADLFNRPGPGVTQAARMLAEALHPGAF